MKRWIYAYRYVPGAPDRLEQRLLAGAAALLRDATLTPEKEPAADGSFTVDLSASLAGVDVAKRIRVHLGVAFRSGSRVMLPVRWYADPARPAFPEFEGSLELEPLDSRTAQLSLAGSYRVPLGALGVAADATVLHGAAQRSAEHLVRGLARALGRQAGTPAQAAPGAGPRRGEPLRVGDVMTTEPLTVDEDLSLRTTALLLFHGEISGAPVVTLDGRLVGVISERDLLAKEASARFGLGRKAAMEDRRRRARTAGEACTRPARVTAPGTRLAEAAREMLDADVSRLVVLDAGRIAGIVTRRDVLAALLRDDHEIEYAVQRLLESVEAPGVQATVSWGAVELAGSVPLLSTAVRLPVLVAEIDGVMTVDAGELSWEVDDTVAQLPYV